MQLFVIDDGREIEPAGSPRKGKVVVERGQAEVVVKGAVARKSIWWRKAGVAWMEDEARLKSVSKSRKGAKGT